MTDAAMSLFTVLAKIVEVLTPDQARQVAVMLRDVPAESASERRFLDGMIASLDRFADEKEAQINHG